MATIFISHSSANNAQALAIADWLRDSGWDEYFLDISPARGLAPGERWQESLKHAADRCEAVLFLLSPVWRESRWCLAEFLLAKQLGKKVFGVMVEAMPLDSLPTEMTAEWQLCDLVAGAERRTFRVSSEPLVQTTEVSFAVAGLERLKVGLQKAGLDPSTFPWPPPQDPERAPYRGLKALDVEDAAIFFGREAAVVRGLDALRGLRERGVEQMLVLLGASGAGKSSFLRAGLWPRLARDDRHFLPLPVIRPARAVISGPTGLIASLETALRRRGRTVARAEIRSRLESTNGFERLLDDLRQQPASPGNDDAFPPTVVIPVDQAEELFAAEEQDETDAFLELLGHTLAPHGESEDAGSAARQRAIAVLAIRSDSYERLQTEPHLAQVKPSLFDLRPMATAECKAVIEGPAARATASGRKLAIDPALTERLLGDTEGVDALPLLAFTLEWLFVEHGGDRDLRLDEYVALGGSRGAIEAAIQASFAEPERPPAIPARGAERDRLLRAAFVPWLARVDPETEERKRRVARWDEIPTASRSLVERLIDQRLLTRDRRAVDDLGEDAVVVEVAHEALLRQWNALTTWLDEDAERLKQAEVVKRAASEWDKNHRHEAWLTHTGPRLEAARALYQGADFAQLLGTIGHEYLTACLARDEHAQAERDAQRQRELEAARTLAAENDMRRKAEAQRAEEAEARVRDRDKAAVHLRKRAWYLACIALIALVLGAASVLFYRRADQSARQTGVALARASTQEAAGLIERDQPSLALAHLARALRLEPGEVVARSWISDLVRGGRLWRPSPPLWHKGRVISAAFSPDGRRIVTNSLDGTARVWDATTGESVAVPLEHGTTAMSAAFSPDGLRIVTASADDTARVWDAATGRPLTAPLEHEQDVFAAAFTPDGRHVVTASDVVRVWDATTGQPAGPPFDAGTIVSSAFLSSDGRLIVGISDETAQVWDVVTGQPFGMPLHQQDVRLVAFSPDGRRIVTISFSSLGDTTTTRVWDVATGQPVGEPVQHKGLVLVATLSSDGSRLLTASNSAQVWDSDTGQPLGAPIQHDERVNSAAFSPDGRWIVTASGDNMARVWDANTGRPVAVLQHQGSVNAAVFSPDGRRIVTVSDDNTARVWVADARRFESVPLKHQKFVNAAVFSPDGRRIVTASDKTARVWDSATGVQVGTPLQHQDAVTTAVFSPDGRRIVTASRDKTARVWDSDTSQPVGEPLQHQNAVNAALFSPDGRRIVTASDDKTARVWDSDTSQPVGEPLQHQDAVNAAVFSPDGRRIVTASKDKTARVWDSDTGQPVGVPLPPHQGAVNAAVFSPDGRRIVTVSDDDPNVSDDTIARVWDTETGQPVDMPLQYLEDVRAVVFSADGRRIVTVSGGTARVWDAATGQPVGAPLRGVRTASFSPEGRRIVTASEDNTARVWDADTSRGVGAPLQHEGRVGAAAFSPDGRRVVTVSGETARVWEILLGWDSEEDASQLADLAEVLGGYQISNLGSPVPLEMPEHLERVRRIVGPDANTSAPVEVLLRRFLPAASR